MKTEGPPLESLTHRLSVCPREFLLPPKTIRTGQVHVAAVVGDTAARMEGRLPSQASVQPFNKVNKRDVPWLRLVLTVCWMASDDWFVGRPGFSEKLLAFLAARLKRLSGLITAEQCVGEPDRREELARSLLAGLGLRPEGETEPEAKDRLNALDSWERERVLEKTRKAQEHARKVREAMRRKKAREAAAKVMRE